MRKSEFVRHITDTKRLDGVERSVAGYHAELERLADIEAGWVRRGYSPKGKYTPRTLLQCRREIVQGQLDAHVAEIAAASPPLTNYDYTTLAAVSLCAETDTPWAERAVVDHASTTGTEARLDESVAHLAKSGLVTLTADGPAITPEGAAYVDRVRQVDPPPVAEYLRAMDAGAPQDEAFARSGAARDYAEAAARAFPSAPEAVARPELSMPKPRAQAKPAQLSAHARMRRPR